MNINELLKELTKRNISLSGRAISQIWGMDETSFSKKKKSGTQIKQKNIIQLEEVLGIKLIKELEKDSINTLERHFDADIKSKRIKFGSRIEEIRNKNNISNARMAGLLNISEKELYDITSGKLQPNIILLDNLKQNFKISIDWLLYGE